MILERKFQGALIKEIKERFPGSIVLKTDPNYIQGLPDLLILYKTHWAALECKRADHAHVQPNQEFYIDVMDRMSFASFITPEMKDEVLHAMERSFESQG